MFSPYQPPTPTVIHPETTSNMPSHKPSRAPAAHLSAQARTHLNILISGNNLSCATVALANERLGRAEELCESCELEELKLLFPVVTSTAQSFEESRFFWGWVFLGCGVFFRGGV